MIGAGRDRKEDAIDPAVGVILEVKVGEKVEAGSVLCRLYYTKEDHVEEAARDGGRRLPHFGAEARRAGTDPGSRKLIWPERTDAAIHRAAGPGCDLAVAWLFSTHKRAIKLRIILWGWGCRFAFAVLVLEDRLRQNLSGASERA